MGDDISVGELYRVILEMKVDNNNDLREIKDHLRALNGRVSTSERDIAVLDDRLRRHPTRAANWTAGIGASVMGIFEVVRWLMGSPQR